MRCLSSQVTPTVVSYHGGAGNIAAAIAFTNHSSSACSIDGYPGVGLVSSHDAVMAVQADRGSDYLFSDPGPTDQVVNPGRSVYFNVGYTDIRMGQPSSSALEINVPNGTHPMFLTTSGSVRAYARPDHINVNAVHPGPPFP